MLWAFLLAFGGLMFAMSWRASDARGQWVAGICIVGIILMQLPVAEPFRWLYAGALWTVAALIIGLMIGAARVALIAALIPLGYWGLYFAAVGAVSLGWWRNAAFGLTEAPAVLAMIIGGWGGVRNLWMGRSDHRVHPMVFGRAIPVATQSDRAAYEKRSGYTGRARAIAKGPET